MIYQKLLFFLLPFVVLSSSFGPAKRNSPDHCVRNGYIYDHVAACTTGTAFCEKYLTTKSRATRTITVTQLTTSSTTKTKKTHITTTITQTSYTGTTTVAAPTSTTTVTTCLPDNVFEDNNNEYPAYGSGYYDSFSIQPREAMEMTQPPVAKPSAADSGKSCGIQSTYSSREVSSACSCFLRKTATLTTTVTKYTVGQTVTTNFPSLITTTTTLTTESTTTTTPTTTVQTGSPDACILPDTSCGNSGLLWAYYRVPEHKLGTDYDTSGGTFDPTLYKKISPLYSGQVQEIGGWRSSRVYTSSKKLKRDRHLVQQAWDIYGHALGEVLSILDHVTYFYPPVTGEYDFYFVNHNRYLLVWIGDEAYSGWNLENLAENTENYSFTYTLTAGQYYPIRILFGAGGDPNALAMYIIGPDNVALLGSNQGPTQYFVTHGCSESDNAPPFPAFGSET